MAKKYIAPTMKVIMVSDDIIATSGGPAFSSQEVDAGDALVGERRGWDEF